MHILVKMMAAAALATGFHWLPAAAEMPPIPTEEPGKEAATTAPIQPKACAANLTYFYNSNLQGASATFCSPIANLSGFTYNQGSGLAGYGQAVKNNAASIRHIVFAGGQPNVNVYELSNFQGKSNYCIPGCQGNLTPALKNENASHRWG